MNASEGGSARTLRNFGESGTRVIGTARMTDSAESFSARAARAT
jgi:hypothetical protein